MRALFRIAAVAVAGATLYYAGLVNSIIIQRPEPGDPTPPPGTNATVRHVPGFRVPVVDTTAAGDAFNAALAVGLAEGMPLPAAVRFANAAGALACTKMGAIPAMPTRAEVDTLLTGT